VRVLIDYRPALRARSGAGEYTHQLVKALLAAYPLSGPASKTGSDLALTVFSSSWKDRLVETPDLRGARAIDRRVPVRLLNFAWHRLGWPPVEQLTGSDFDVVHSSHPLLLPSRHAAQVITIHDLDFLAHPERTRAEIRRDYPALVREHARRAARIIVPSQFTAVEVERQLGVAAERVAICPPGAPDWISPRPSPPSDGYILFFSTLEPRKNVGGLLDAYERLIALSEHGPTNGPAEAGHYVRNGNVRNGGLQDGQWFSIPELILAGRATEEARPWLERIARPPLAGHVRHIGYVEPANRHALYSGARMLVMPSFAEGFGLPVLEAMTLGVPVVASNRGSLPEVLGDAGPLVNPDEPDEIAGAMARVLHDEAYRSACASKGVSRARQFNWPRTARLVYDVYRQAAADRQSGRGARTH
jgi:glycosyltransferase involved in cell wall biosynthesis